MSPLAVSREDFLRALFEGAKGKIELRALAPDGRIVGQCFSDVGNGAWREAFLTQHARANVFFGVANRKGNSGKLEQCLTVGALWADIDFKTVSEEEARELAMAFAIPPSIALLSGGGAHLYWLLRERLGVGDLALLPALRGLAAVLHADRAAAEPARVLRVPGTKNYKYDPPREVVITQFYPDRRVTLAEILRHLPAEPAENNGQRSTFQVPDLIVEGARNDTVYKLGRSLKARGLSPDGIAAALRAENAARCAPPLDEAELAELVAHVIEQPDRPRLESAQPLGPEAANGASGSEVAPTPPVSWTLYDGAAAWGFPALAYLVDDLLPLKGLVWWGGLPKRGKSLLLLYVCLCIAVGRQAVAGHFAIQRRPRILYVSEEDGGARLQARRDDILAAWGADGTLATGAICFVIRPHLDLFNAAHVRWLRETCLSEHITVLVLDTWTALSPGADPVGAQDQTRLAQVVAALCVAIDGLVIVVDHSRKNRPDGALLSSADILGPSQKWQRAEHIVMLDALGDGRRLEVFLESKDAEGSRFFLDRAAKDSGTEKFTYAGTVTAVVEASREKGALNRAKVLDTLRRIAPVSGSAASIQALQVSGLDLSRDTIRAHLAALIREDKAGALGTGKATRYWAVVNAPETSTSPKRADPNE